METRQVPYANKFADLLNMPFGLSRIYLTSWTPMIYMFRLQEELEWMVQGLSHEKGKTERWEGHSHHILFSSKIYLYFPQFNNSKSISQLYEKWASISYSELNYLARQLLSWFPFQQNCSLFFYNKKAPKNLTKKIKNMTLLYNNMSSHLNGISSYVWASRVKWKH